MILVCVHCAGQFRIQDSAIAEPGSRVSCPSCSKVFIVNVPPEPDSAPRTGPGSQQTTPASEAAPAEREGDWGFGGGREKSAEGSSDRLAAARNAVDDLLTPVSKPARRAYPPTPPPRRTPPPQPARAAPEPRDQRPASSPAPRRIASESPAVEPAAPLDVARQWLRSGLESLAPWMTAAAGIPVAAPAGAAALLLGLLGAILFWPYGDAPEPPQQAAEVTRPDAATAGLDPEASPRSSGQAGASPPEPARRQARVGGWAGVVGSSAETKRAPETPEAVALPAAPATEVTAAEPADPAPAKAVPAAKPRPAPAAPAKVIATSGPRTTTVKPKPRSTSTVRSTARTKPRTASTTRSPTRRPRTVTRTPVSQKTISSESATSQQQGDSGWVVEY